MLDNVNNGLMPSDTFEKQIPKEKEKKSMPMPIL
jgi:hypothetical protein